ncbi:TPA: class I SAM-dependent DNA methyltransferase [Legionella pneumophila]|nr:N-6 DNA methylase [Legionella pneumophila subsp. pneumophila]HAU0786461.1 class I SAM-dependent DNA methyltransferase [Legionella pneumophila]HAU0811894.1 class I SAM-dependent DNA methyltransferase [Legionella pneumophila]HAU0907743.1 class I SAM-dependent DNA methyltransferase [Legionella pneumophila]HAU0937518.1 class I SAM-dependent DNA methyltransferase [Legionella pneumophila]
MPLSWNEIKNRAFAFSKEWADETSEAAEAKSFWDSFFHVFGISRRRTASFESPVKKISNQDGYIDLLWKGFLLVEHKSRGKNLDTAFQQAKDYFPGLKEDELPRYIVVSDFARFRIYDLDKNKVNEFNLNDLHKNVHLFGFIAGYKANEIKPEDPVNIKAAQLLGKLHDHLKSVGYEGIELEVYLVRVLFCLFSDDTGIFEVQQFQDYVELRTTEDGSDLAYHLATLFHVLNTEETQRLKNLDEQLAEFPYINGKLFEKVLSPASFDRDMRQMLLTCCSLDWSLISPAIFGSLFQSVMDETLRRSLGVHYTTEQNILKVINPLFLQQFRQEFNKIKYNKDKLKNFHQRLARIKFFDPACGCGNFLAITYREVRKLELDVLLQLYKNEDTSSFNILEVTLVDVDQFYGIEIGEFPSQIAQVSLWMTDHQMNIAVSEAFGQYFKRLPLKKSPNILCGNSIEEDWVDFVKPGEETYILSNPPFCGKQYQNTEQKKDMKKMFSSVKGAGILDYVSAWYIKAAQFMNNSPSTKTAYVSTNSITQGEQVSILWKELMQKYGVNIFFAHRTFKWGSEVSKGKAAVHCVIIGFSNLVHRKKIIFDYDNVMSETPQPINAKNINPYLVDAPNIFLNNRKSPIRSDIPNIVFGNMPNDGGNLLLTDEEKINFEREEPGSKKWIKPFMGAREFLNGIKKWCFWLEEIPPSELKSLPLLSKRVVAVKEHRINSARAITRKLAHYPTLFGERRQPKQNYILIPRVSSERRKYIPIGFFAPDVIVGDTNLCIPGATLYHFGVLSSSMHMAWVRAICGRLKSDYRYSNLLVYNNFPWPNITDKQRLKIENLAQIILNIRLKYINNSMADIYDPLAMPSDLVRAHEELNRAVEAVYGRFSFESDAERLSFLFEKYQEQNTSSKNQIEHKVSDLRLTLASMIVKELAKSRSFGKTKFAKVFYITDMLCEQDLGTKYFREVAGPVDYNVLYNPQHRIEVLAEKHGYFITEKVGKGFRYILGKNIQEVEEHEELFFGQNVTELKRIISKFQKLNTEQAEMIATLFACWNDLLIEKKNITDELIVNEFQNNWDLSKKRFETKRLFRALEQMREHFIIPKGTKGHTFKKLQKPPPIGELEFNP